ncbi:MAG: ABC transporter ATP-binding protein [Acidobacteriota bacterium]|nr:ABC transporter ATP-binding protein [Acidobacteriota bacterium]
MIELQGVTRVFNVGDTQVRALDGLDLKVDPGDYLAIMGPSGSGKSTLLNILGCLDRPSSGTYRLDGREVGTLSDNDMADVRLHKIGFVFQFFHLVPRLTAQANVELPMVFAGLAPSERAKRAREALGTVGLSGRANHRPPQLSGGERQRVALARATIMGPALLLADEPTGNLDRASGREVVELLERMNARGLTLIVVTHDPELGQRARRLLRLVDGRQTNESV